MLSHHSLLSPSSAAVWVECHGSALLRAAYPRPDTQESIEGDQAHACGEALVRRPDVTPEGTVEMIEAARVYADDILTIVPEDRRGEIQLEKSITIPRVHPECYGTPDAYWYDAKARELYIWDLKYGFGWVEAPNNWQGICYAAGLIPEDDRSVKVIITIVQPRAFHPGGPVRRWETTAEDLRGPINQLTNAAAKIMQTHTDQPVQTGPHCRYCGARHECKAIAELASFAVECSDVVNMPTGRDANSVGIELLYLRAAQDRLSYRITGLEADLESRIRSKEHCAFFGLVGGTSAKKWSVPPSEAISLAKTCGVNIEKPPQALTPTQAISAGVPAELIDTISKREPKALKLKPIDTTEAARVFGLK